MATYRIGVTIETSSGTFLRVGDPFTASAPFNADHAYLSYPDNRVKEFLVYLSVPPDWNFKRFKATKSEKSNVSYVNLPPNLASWEGAITDANLTAAIRKNDRDANRVIVSETYKPRLLLGRNTHYIGESAEDGVLRFEANVQPISQGQFGQYPLYAFCRNTYWAMQVGDGGVAFVRISPASVSKGIIGALAAVNIDGMVFFASLNGVWTIPQGEAPISFPIQNSDEINDLLRNLYANTSLGVFEDRSTGRRELWLSTAERIYCFSLEHKAWFTRDYPRLALLRVGQKRLGLGTDGVMYDELGANINAVVDIDSTALIPEMPAEIKTAPIHFGEPETLKRFRLVVAHIGTQSLFVRLNPVTAPPDTAYYSDTLYQYVFDTEAIEFDIDGPFLSLDITADARYTHRERVKRE